MSVSSHRHYISTTADDLERAAGTLEIKAKAEPDALTRSRLIGGAAALRCLAKYELNTAKDFWAVFQAEAFINNRQETTETEE